MSAVIEEHRAYLADHTRVAAFDAAIRETVRPGDVVLDLASGTGILGLLACRAGAARVYCVESGAIVGFAREIAAANGFADRMTFIRDHSTRAELPERADVLVTDQISRFGFESALLDVVADAQRRLLKPMHRLVPAAIRLQAAPVERPDEWAAVRFWSEPVAGLTVQPLQRPAKSTGYPVELAARDLLAAPADLATIDVAASVERLSLRVDSTIDVDGTMHGIACWFDAQLSPSVCMTNSPVAAQRIDRRQSFFPAERPVAVRRGDQLSLAMTILLSARIVTWTVDVRPSGAVRPTATFSGSTFHSLLMSAEDMTHTDPRFVPSLTAAGRGRRTVLELCDGRRDLATIERVLLARHPDLFARADDAAIFVAEIVSGCARQA
jgi:protein arginine N-methyltransferase 1